MSNLKKFRIKSYKIDEKILKIEKLSLKIQNKIILDDFDLELNHGQILGILGPNGAGKSTLFNLIIGLLKPNSGSIIINSKKVNEYPIYTRARQFQIGFVPQNGGYFHDLTVYENLKSISEITIKNKSDIEEKINSLIDKFELSNIKNAKADLLSGGQKKKLVIALALLSEPKVLLLDECFAALDVLTIKMLQEIIVNLQHENNITICICDHQARDLLACVDIAMILSNCKIIAQDTPSNLVKDIDAKNAYFGESFKIN